MDEHGEPIMKGVLDAKNIFSPTTIKQLWADYARCIEKYGVSKAEGKVPKGMYAEVATMYAVIEQKQAEIEVLSEMLLKGQDRFQEIERRMAAVSGSLDALEGVIRGHEKHSVGTPVYSDPMCQEVIAATLFPTLADWDIVKRVDDSTLILQNSRTFGAAQIRFGVGGPYVRMYENTYEVGQDGRYVYRWTKEQRYDHYLYSHPREFEDLGRAGVADTYVRHLLQFSLRLRSQHAFEDVMYTAASVSPSVRCHLIPERLERAKPSYASLKFSESFWRFGKTLYICNMIIGGRKARLDDELGISPH